jgi:hypothetical protein
MRKKINQTNFAITGAAALFVGLAGNVQAIPMPMHSQNVNEAVQAAARKEAALLARSPRVPKVVAGSNPVASNVGPARHGVPVTLSPLTIQHHPPHYVAHNGTPGLTPYVYTEPSTINLVLPQGGTVAKVSSAAVGVPDGGPTAAMMAGALGGLVLLRKKLESGSGLSKTGV